MLGLFVTKAPRAMRSVEESIEAIKEQGGLVVVPHPLGRLVPSLSRAKIDELLTKGYPIDGIEMYNPTPANASMRPVVRAANREWGLAETGGSDAHFWQHIARPIPFSPVRLRDLRRAIVERTSRPGGQGTTGASPPASMWPNAHGVGLWILRAVLPVPSVSETGKTLQRIGHSNLTWFVCYATIAPVRGSVTNREEHFYELI